MSVNVSHFLSDNIVTVSCLADLPPTVNNREMVITTWFSPNGQLDNSSTVTISNTYATANGAFQSDITITEYVPAVHNGEYICNATVIPSSSFVIGSSGTDTGSVMLSG